MPPTPQEDGIDSVGQAIYAQQKRERELREAIARLTKDWHGHLARAVLVKNEIDRLKPLLAIAEQYGD